MIKHNLLVAIRSYLRFKSQFLINLIGLASGFASALIIFLWVVDETSTDKFHEKDERLYKVMQNFKLPDGTMTLDITPYPLSKVLLEELPEVEEVASLNSLFWFNGAEGILSKQDDNVKALALFATDNFFEVFTYPLLHGSKDQVLADKKGVVISESLAKKMYQNTDNAVGKVIEWEHRIFNGTFQVAGVFKDIPHNSSAKFDIVFDYDVLLDNNEHIKRWNSDHAETYIVLREGADIDSFNDKIKNLIQDKHEIRANSTLFAQLNSDRYLNGQYENGQPVGGRISYVRAFTAIALFILIVASINFINLSTAQASRRMKEVGVKKALGLPRETLIRQFMFESFLMVVLSLLAAMMFLWLLLPQLNELTGKQLQLNINPGLILPIVLTVIFTTLLSGSYPAFYLSSFKPAVVLKGKLNLSFGDQWVRKGLVIFQFAISVVFIIGFMITNRQIEYTQTKNLGYNRDNVIFFRPDGKFTEEHFNALMPRIQNVPGVVAVSATLGDMFDNMSPNAGWSWDGKLEKEDIPYPSLQINHGFIETLGIVMKEGRSYSDDFSTEQNNVILNEAAVKLIGYDNPVGKTIKFYDENRTIIGVVKDFHYGSLHEEIEPVFFRYFPQGRNFIIKVMAGTEQATLGAIEEIYRDVKPSDPFEFIFMDDKYSALYDTEKRVASLSQYFTVIAVLISCLGMFGLAAFTTEKRLKEIALRKVMGSTNMDIVTLLVRDFTKVVLISIVIALPIGYLLIKDWLEGFAYRIDLSIWYFLLTAVLTIAICWLTVSFVTFKAAQKNPLISLRSE